MISLPNLSQLHLITPEPTDVKRVNPFAQPRRDAKPETPIQKQTWKMAEERLAKEADERLAGMQKEADERLARMQRREANKDGTVDLNVELTNAILTNEEGRRLTSRANFEFVIKIPKGSPLKRLIPFFWFDRARDDRRHPSELYRMIEDTRVPSDPELELQEALNVARDNSATNDHRLRMFNAMRDMGVKYLANEGYTSPSTDVTFDVRFSQGSLYMPAKLRLNWNFQHPESSFFTTMVRDRQLTPEFDAFRQKFMQTIDFVLLQATGRRLVMETEKQTNEDIKFQRYQSGTDLFEAKASYKFVTR